MTPIHKTLMHRPNKATQLCRIFVLVTLTSLCSNVLAGHKKVAPVRIAFTFSMPPYLSTDHSAGIELDIIRSALAHSGHSEVEIENVHYLRAIDLAKSGIVDLIVSNKMNTAYQDLIPEAHNSNATIHYVDCAISLKERKLQPSSIKYYYGKRIWAFKSASQTLGAEFLKMTQANPNYTEEFDQQKQLEMLAMHRIDIAISDRNIFAEKLRNHSLYEDYQFSYNKIGSTTPRSVRSTSQALIDNFNKGLTTIRENGQYEEILKRYSSRYHGDCDKL